MTPECSDIIIAQRDGAAALQHLAAGVRGRCTSWSCHSWTNGRIAPFRPRTHQHGMGPPAALISVLRLQPVVHATSCELSLVYCAGLHCMQQAHPNNYQLGSASESSSSLLTLCWLGLRRRCAQCSAWTREMPMPSRQRLFTPARCSRSRVCGGLRALKGLNLTCRGILGS